MAKSSGTVLGERQQHRAAFGLAESPRVTPAEMAVLKMLVHGASNKEIAAARNVSPKTVDHQMQGLFTKFKVGSRGALVACVLKNGIVTLAEA